MNRTLGNVLGALAIAVVPVAAGAGCAEHAFSAHARDNSAEDLRRAIGLSKAPQKGPQNGSGHAMIFGVTAGLAADKQIVGIDLASGNVVWKLPSDVRSRISVGKGIVAHRQGERDLVGRDPQSGQVRYTVQLGADERFMGLSVDDEHMYYVVQSAATGRRVSYTVGVDRSGHELWRTPAQGTLGAPASRGGLVAVPFASQNLSLLDGATGKEVGRVRSTDEQISFVRGTPEGLFYGNTKGVYLLDEKSASGTKGGSSYIEAKLASDQMRPFYSWDAYQATQADYSAFDRNRLLWRAEPKSGGVAFEGDRAVLHSYRYLFAFDTKSGKIRWAYAHPRIDVVASDDVGSAIVFVAADGDIGAINERTGNAKSLAKTGLKLAGATVDADGLQVEGGDAEVSNGLRAALEQIVWDPDARFTSIKVFAVGALGEIPGAETTAALVKIVRAETGLPRAAQKRAGEALIARKDKSADKLLVESLATHTDFLAGRRAVGVDVLARAAAEIGSKDAAPLIGAHLADPETPQGSLKDLVLALGTLGGKDAGRALKAFLLTYRADPMFLQDPSPLVAAGSALIALGGDERRIAAFVASERRTLPPVAEALNRQLSEAGKSKKKADGQDATKGTAPPASTPAAKAASAKPPVEAASDEKP